MQWNAGLPGFSGSASRSLGRLKSYGAQKTWGLDEHGRLRPVVEFRLNPEEGRELITGVAEQLGLTQRRGTAEKIGLVAAIVGGAGAVVTVLSLLVLAMLGNPEVAGELLVAFVMGGAVVGLVAWLMPTRWPRWLYPIVVFVAVLFFRLISVLPQIAATT